MPNLTAPRYEVRRIGTPNTDYSGYALFDTFTQTFVTTTLGTPETIRPVPLATATRMARLHNLRYDQSKG